MCSPTWPTQSHAVPADVITVETSDHARLQLQLSYNWHFEVDKKSTEDATKIFSVPDFVGDACKAVASRVRGAVAQVAFDNFHKASASVIRAAVFGKDQQRFVFEANKLVISEAAQYEPTHSRMHFHYRTHFHYRSSARTTVDMPFSLPCPAPPLDHPRSTDPADPTDQPIKPHVALPNLACSRPRRLRLPALRLAANIDIQAVEPVDSKTRESLQKSVQLAIGITTQSQEAAARQEAERTEQEARGRLERQKIQDEAMAEKARRELLTLQVESAAIESSGTAKAEAMARSEAAEIDGQAAVAMAKLRAQALELESRSQLEMMRLAKEAEIAHQKALDELELQRCKELSEVRCPTSMLGPKPWISTPNTSLFQLATSHSSSHPHLIFFRSSPRNLRSRSLRSAPKPSLQSPRLAARRRPSCCRVSAYSRCSLRMATRRSTSSMPPPVCWAVPRRSEGRAKGTVRKGCARHLTRSCDQWG